MKNSLLLALPLSALACAAPADDASRAVSSEAFPWPPSELAPELGTVNWCRDLELAETEAKKKDQPILLVFQEVPG